MVYIIANINNNTGHGSDKFNINFVVTLIHFSRGKTYSKGRICSRCGRVRRNQNTTNSSTFSSTHTVVIPSCFPVGETRGYLVYQRNTLSKISAGKNTGGEGPHGRGYIDDLINVKPTQKRTQLVHDLYAPTFTLSSTIRTTFLN